MVVATGKSPTSRESSAVEGGDELGWRFLRGVSAAGAATKSGTEVKKKRILKKGKVVPPARGFGRFRGAFAFETAGKAGAMSSLCRITSTT